MLSFPTVSCIISSLPSDSENMYISGDDSSCSEPDIFLCSDDDSGSISTCYFINNYIVGGMHELTTEGGCIHK